MNPITTVLSVVKKIKTHTLAKNAAFNSGSFVFISLVALIITPFIVKNLTIEGYGIYILLTSVFGYYGIFDLGLGQGLIKFVSEYQATKDYKRLNSAINSIFWTQFILGALMSILLVLFASEIVAVFHVSPVNYSITVIALKISAIGFFFSMLSATFSSVLIGLQRYDITSITDSTINFTLNILVLIISFLKYGLQGVVIVTVISSIISFIVYCIILHFKLPQYKIYFLLDFSILKQFLAFSGNIFLSKLSSIFANYIVRFVVSFFLGPSAVTYYVIPSKLLGAYGGVLSSAANTLFPFTSNLAANGKNSDIKTLFLKASSLFVAFSLPISMFIAIFSKGILTLWMGRDFAENSWMVLSILSISSTIGGFSAVPNLIILGMGNSKLIGIFSMITVVLYIVFLPLFTKYFGINGASCSLLLTSLIVISYVIMKTNEYVEVKFSEYWNTVFSVHILPAFLFLLTGFIVLFASDTHYLVALLIGGALVLSYFYFLYNKKNILVTIKE
jgi:O-antigen/teichoic acid export membrane protein